MSFQPVQDKLSGCGPSLSLPGKRPNLPWAVQCLTAPSILCHILPNLENHLPVETSKSSLKSRAWPSILYSLPLWSIGSLLLSCDQLEIWIRITGSTSFPLAGLVVRVQETCEKWDSGASPAPGSRGLCFSETNFSFPVPHPFRITRTSATLGRPPQVTLPASNRVPFTALQLYKAQGASTWQFFILSVNLVVKSKRKLQMGSQGRGKSRERQAVGSRHCLSPCAKPDQDRQP